MRTPRATRCRSCSPSATTLRTTTCCRFVRARIIHHRCPAQCRSAWHSRWLEPVCQTAREEKYTAEFRKHLRLSGVPVENSKGEAGPGQHELNVRFAEILEMADRHTVYKQCLKEVRVRVRAPVNSLTMGSRPLRAWRLYLIVLNGWSFVMFSSRLPTSWAVR